MSLIEQDFGGTRRGGELKHDSQIIQKLFRFPQLFQNLYGTTQ
jgi:hypothetical protein